MFRAQGSGPLTAAALASFLLVAVANFAFIGLKAAMQRSVAWGKYAWVPVLSGLLACCEYVVIRSIVTHGPWAIIPLWLGGSLGCVSSMYLTRSWSK